jgi:uroporphyrinogen decarboxylase
MNSKERVLATMRRQPTDRTPLDCWLYQKQFVEMLEAEYGPRDKFLDEFNIDLFTGFVPWPNQLGHMIDVSELAGVDLGDARSPRWLTHTEWSEDFAGVNIRQAVERYGDRRAISAHVWGIVEGTSSFLGVENCWLNLGMEPVLMQAWFERYSTWLCALTDNLIDAGVDLITLSDDWGSNQNMLFSPKLWRELIAPFAGRVVKHVRARGVPVNLHSDGYIMNILDDIVALGYTSMHPVQESAGMDPQVIKEKYGDKLVIYGSLDVMDALMAYDGKELDDYITRRFAIYAPGGGFIFSSGHFIQPDIPPQRLIRAYTLANKLAREYAA